MPWHIHNHTIIAKTVARYCLRNVVYLKTLPSALQGLLEQCKCASGVSRCIPVVFLAVNLNWFVPCPHIIHKGLVLLALGIKLGEAVGLVVRGDLESGESFLSTDKEGTLDDGVVGDAEDGAGTEEVLAASLETVEEAA
jgi:hypothetical protein